MLWVYYGDLTNAILKAKRDLPPHIDISATLCQNLASTSDDFCMHHRIHVYLGYLDPLLMLSPQHETRLRKLFRLCNVSVVVSDPLLLPFAWKNSIAKLVQILPSKSVVM